MVLTIALGTTVSVVQTSARLPGQETDARCTDTGQKAQQLTNRQLHQKHLCTYNANLMAVKLLIAAKVDLGNIVAQELGDHRYVTWAVLHVASLLAVSSNTYTCRFGLRWLKSQQINFLSMQPMKRQRKIGRERAKQKRR